MVQFFDVSQPPAFGDVLGQALGGGLGKGFSEGLTSQMNQMFQQKQNQQQLEGLTPILKNLGIPEEGIKQMIQSGLDPKTVATLAAQFGKQQQLQQQFAAKEQKELKETEEKKEKEKEPFKHGLEIIKEQRKILERGNLGPKFSLGAVLTGNEKQMRKPFSTLTAQGKKDRAQYQRLGKSLISMASNIPIRNRLEFEVLGESLYDPHLTRSEIEGNLEAMEKILLNNLSPEEQESYFKEKSPEISKNLKKPPLTSFYK